MLGRPLGPLTPPGGIGRIVGRPIDELVGGIVVAVEEGYSIDCDMPL